VSNAAGVAGPLGVDPTLVSQAAISIQGRQKRLPEVKTRAQAEWNSMKLELGERLPNFEETFARVLVFYQSLPWV